MTCIAGLVDGTSGRVVIGGDSCAFSGWDITPGVVKVFHNGPYLILLRQKTPDFSPGDEWRSGSPCARLSAYRRACGNLRLWSGTDNQGSNARVSRSQRFTFG
jgi:hypothetical protein